MKRMRIEWECNWEPRKVAMVQGELQRTFSRMGGVSNIGSLRIAIDNEPIQERPKLQLHCAQYLLKEKKVCGARWESEFFTPCPSCGNRAFVRKGVPEPTTALQDQAAASETPAAAPPAEPPAVLDY